MSREETEFHKHLLSNEYAQLKSYAHKLIYLAVPEGKAIFKNEICKISLQTCIDK